MILMQCVKYMKQVHLYYSEMMLRWVEYIGMVTTVEFDNPSTGCSFLVQSTRGHEVSVTYPWDPEYALMWEMEVCTSALRVPCVVDSRLSTVLSLEADVPSGADVDSWAWPVGIWASSESIVPSRAALVSCIYSRLVRSPIRVLSSTDAGRRGASDHGSSVTTAR